MFSGCVLEQRGEQCGAFLVGDTPADDASAENVDDDVEIEIGPFGWSHQLGDVPRPDFVGRLRQQLRLFIDWMPQLLAPLSDFLTSCQDGVHGADRAMVDALVEQASVDLGGGLIGEERRVEMVDDGLRVFDNTATSRLPPRAAVASLPRRSPASPL